MHRRNLIRLLGAAAALPLVPGSGDAAQLGRLLHAGRQPATDLQLLTVDQAALVTLLGDMIIPATDTPGASDVGVTGFIDHLLARWYQPDEVQPLLAGLAAIDRLAVERHGQRFVDLAETDRVGLLTTIDGGKGEKGTAEATFARIKSLTVYGYFTSERVMLEVTREPIIPGRFDGCARM
ncbi:MAG: gluconate 2-dehydrogenase subunit 3 family protein [Gemmatimonadales bacterium]